MGILSMAIDIVDERAFTIEVVCGLRRESSGIGLDVGASQEVVAES